MDNLLNEMRVLEQIVIEDTYARYNVREKVRNDILSSVETGLVDIFASVCQAIDNYISKRYYKSKDDRIQMIRHIATIDIAVEIFIAVTPHDTFTAIQGVSAAIGAQLGYEDVFDGVKTASELLGACVDTGLYDIQSTFTSETGSLVIKSNVLLEQDTIDFVNKTRYLPPMLTEPKPWISNINGGYITKNTSVILKGHNFHMKEQALDVLNILQSIEWEINEEVFAEEETPKEPFENEHQEQSFEIMKDGTQFIGEQLIQQGNSFYFVWKNDFRGRVYSQGHDINLQSSEYRKALLDFKHKEVINA